MLHLGSRQCGLQAHAAGLHVPPRETNGADAQGNDDTQGHPRPSGKQPSFGKTVASHPGEPGLCVNEAGPH